MVVLVVVSGKSQIPGNAISLDGIDDYLLSSFSSSIDNNYTVEFWLYLPSDTSNGLVFGRDNSPSCLYEPSLLLDSLAITSRVSGCSGSGIFGSASIEAFKWYHIAMAVSPDSQMLYINGTQVSKDYNYTNYASLKHSIGAYYDPYYLTTQSFCRIKMDELRIWSLTRTQTQIQNTMSDTLSPIFYQTSDSGLVAYYRFDSFEDLGVNSDGVDDIRDLSVNLNHLDAEGNPKITDVNEFQITQIADVPNDQGKNVRISWNKSKYDCDTNSDSIITKYSVWRKIDPNLSIHKTSLLNDSPTGDWDFITEVPATNDNSYNVIVSTLADSNQNGMYYSIYYLRAHSKLNSIQWHTNPDSGYSVDNLAPLAVENLSASLKTGSSVELIWKKNEDDDLFYYNIYRSNQENDGYKKIGATKANTYVDNLSSDSTYYYIVSGIDFNGNEGDFSNVASTTTSFADGKTVIPKSAHLYQNYPNPFNPETTIHFYLPTEQNVEISLYSVQGKLIKTLYSGIKPKGESILRLQGTDLPSGSYIIEMEANNKVQRIKAIMLK